MQLKLKNKGTCMTLQAVQKKGEWKDTYTSSQTVQQIGGGGGEGEPAQIARLYKRKEEKGRPACVCRLYNHREHKGCLHTPC